MINFNQHTDGAIGRFKDTLDNSCIITVATDGTLRIGVTENYDLEAGTPMRLDTALIKELLPILMYYLKYGDLPSSSELQMSSFTKLVYEK